MRKTRFAMRPDRQQSSIAQAFEQLLYLAADLSASVNQRPYRWLTMWLWHGSAPGILCYRLNRFGYLLFGRSYRVIRVLLWPFFQALRIFGPVLEISYHAHIAPGLRIPHPTLGVMVSGHAKCGHGLVLTGGSWIALRSPDFPGDIRVGNNVVLRANAAALGPVNIGDNSLIGTGAVSLSNCRSASTMVGVPAQPVLDRSSRAAAPGTL